jgi:hypothetical protein
MWIPSTKRRHKDLLYYKTYLPCEEIERGNRERCENVKQDLNTLENRKARKSEAEQVKLISQILINALIGLRSEFKIHGNDSRK